MNLQIEYTPSYKIAYLRQIGPYGQNNVQLMEKLKDWARTKGLLNNTAIILGIAHDNPQFVEPKKCRYDTCLVISDAEDITEDNINLGSITGGKYAVFTIVHTTGAVQKAWLDIFPELYVKGYLMDETRPIIERYRTELVSKHVCEICVPIK